MYVVDGYNAIRRVPRLAQAERGAGLEAGREALVAAILASGVLRNGNAIVVFDGASEASPSAPSPHPRLAIRFAAAPRTADDVIVELVASTRKREGLVVVTADRELDWRVRELGASAIPPERWSALRQKRRRGKRRPAPGAEPSGKPTASRREVDYWLEVFGADEKDEP